ncbi:allantoinase AllB [Curtobacterium sp. 'Ferrero']|uniref:allantoinase AllB n=1 Tax=Curtobacterium sp. 'Ferrero' TaxID=2033654 RepID=UPI000BCF48C3|nr:allantoinase AllB [Curtobacterium sp. 'Ferrero']PCN47802.1 allantoinase AllB [Curtobacterium sp. 'Ferrero']
MSASPAGPPEPNRASTAVRGERVWTEGALRPATVVVRGERIEAVLPVDATIDVDTVVEVPRGAVLLPGLVDTHVHVNEPGRTEWEGFASATRAAALGGVTTIVDMPLNSIPPTTTPEALAVKRASAEGRVAVDVGFWGGAVPENAGALGPLWDAGVHGFKCFLAPSGVDEFGHLDAAQLRTALAEVAALDALLIVHAEDPDDLGDGGALGTGYEAFLASRPPAAEEHAIARLVDGVRATGARAHVLHLSDAGALPMLRAAKAEGLPITVETCPHYLTFDAEHVPDGATEYKCCPPIRDADNQDALWEGLLDGTIDMVVTDHSPSTAELKRGSGGDFGLAWGGIAGLQVGFRATWTEAARRGVPLEQLLPAFTTGPAALVGYADRGVIASGAAAHLVVFDPDAQETVHAAELEHRNPVSAYDGHELRGRVLDTWLHGRPVASAARGVFRTDGRLLRRD